MPKRYVQNDTGAPIFVGGVMIDHNQGREVEVPDHDLPEGVSAAGGGSEAGGGQEGGLSEEEQARLKREENLREILAGNSKSVLAVLPDASDETLAELARLEGEATPPRKGVLEAIAALQLKRAQERAGGAPT